MISARKKRSSKVYGVASSFERMNAADHTESRYRIVIDIKETYETYARVRTESFHLSVTSSVCLSPLVSSVSSVM